MLKGIKVEKIETLLIIINILYKLHQAKLDLIKYSK